MLPVKEAKPYPFIKITVVALGWMGPVFWTVRERRGYKATGNYTQPIWMNFSLQLFCHNGKSRTGKLYISLSVRGVVPPLPAC